eukprot:g1900.t1
MAMPNFLWRLALLATAAAATDDTSEVEAAISRAVFFDDFEGTDPLGAGGAWTKSTDEKYAGQPVAVSSSNLAGNFSSEKALTLEGAAKHYGVTGSFPTAAGGAAGEGFVVQYELRLANGLECGGAYLKLLDADGFEAAGLKDDSPYIVMFGPDRCGATNKVHFIMRHRNPKSGKWEEKHFKSPPPIATDDRQPHLYTLVVRGDNSFEIFIDQQSKAKGSLLEDLEPAVNPAKVIDDPTDTKPGDWVDEEKIKDPAASKPDDWDEDEPYEIEDADAKKPAGWLDDAPLKVPDPDAPKPDDWDDEEDGEFEAPIVDNPACKAAGCGEWKRPFIKNPKFKGKWVAPLIDNPAYKGEWAPKQIDNPHYFEDKEPFRLPKMGGAAVEVWTMSAGLQFDNVYVGHSEADARTIGAGTWAKKAAAERDEAKAKASAARKKERDAMRAEGALGSAQALVLDTLDSMAENVLAALLTVTALLVATLYYCCRGGPEDEDYAPEGPEGNESKSSDGAKKTALHRSVTATTDLKDGEGEPAKPKATKLHRSVTATTDLVADEEGKEMADEDEDEDDSDEEEDDDEEEEEGESSVASRVRKRRTRRAE